MEQQEVITKAKEAAEAVRQVDAPVRTPPLHRIWRPNRAAARKLFRCSCGRLYWNDRPDDIARIHDGHTARLATRGTVWEWFKVKTGLLYPLERLAARMGW